MVRGVCVCGGAGGGGGGGGVWVWVCVLFSCSYYVWLIMSGLNFQSEVFS